MNINDTPLIKWVWLSGAVRAHLGRGKPHDGCGGGSGNRRAGQTELFREHQKPVIKEILRVYV